MKQTTQSVIKQVASKIKSRRLWLEYSQDYMAAKLKISQNAYSKIELGYTNFTYLRVLEIADILEIDALKLLL